jgi:lipopolysaccharide export system permease protein
MLSLKQFAKLKKLRELKRLKKPLIKTAKRLNPKNLKNINWKKVKDFRLKDLKRVNWKKILRPKLPKCLQFTVIDRYIIRKFLGTFAFSLLLLLAIVIMFDINEKLDAFLKAPLHATIFQYFVNFIPYFANQFAPLFTFIAVIFFTSKLAGNSEIIAMLSSGMSFKRLLRPYMFSALVIAIATFILSAYIIPPANVKRIAYTNNYVKNRRVDYGSNIMLMASPGEIAYMSRYDNIAKTGSKFSLDKFDDNKKVVTRLTAQSVRWDTLYNWTIRDYVIRDFKGNREYVRRGRTLDTILPFEPRDFLISKGDWEMMSTPALSKYVERQKERGVANIQQFELEYHRRFAMTAAAFILTVIGMALSSRKVKGGMGLNLGIGLVLSFGYILFMTITQAFAVSGLTSPMIAMWIPNMVFALIAIVLYIRASR